MSNNKDFGDNNSNLNDDASDRKKINLRKTKRAAVASARIINTVSSSNQVATSYDSTTTNTAVIPPSITTFLNHRQSSNAEESGSGNKSKSDHSTTHFIKGGTPFDPVCPPFTLSQYGEQSLYTLVLLRHGESEWNKENRYTGWCDVHLTSKGKREARDAGRLLKENGIELDHAFTSVLRRANFTTNMALNTAEQHWVPVTKSWRLNERHYGALQGYNKDTAYSELGIDQELVMEMRRSYATRPPPMMNTHPHWHGSDRRYRKLSYDQLERSRGESLRDTAERIMPFFNTVVLPSLKAGNKCLIVSHANTIRTLIKQIDNISDEDIKGMSIPTGIPLLYRLDKDFKPVDPNVELEFRYMVEPKGYTWATSRAHGFHGVYLGDLKRLQEIQRKRDSTNRDWQRIILRNLGKSLDGKGGDEFVGSNANNTTTDAGTGTCPSRATSNSKVMEIRQLWWQIHTKMQQKEFSNMLILVRMKDRLEALMYKRKQRFITYGAFERLINKIHLDTKGQIVEPFVDLKESGISTEDRAKLYHENMALDLEEECLIK